MSCEHCRGAVGADQDRVQFNGSCGHTLHLACYNRCLMGRTRGCCQGDAPLGDGLRTRIFNPLGAENTAVDPVPEPQNLIDQFRRMNAQIGASVERSPAAAIRAGLSVADLLSRGFDATAIVQGAKATEPLFGILTAKYSAAEIRRLGFTYDALVAVGFSRHSWDRSKLSAAGLHDIGVTGAQVIESLGGINNLPNLDLSADEWQTLCLPDTATEVFRRLHISPATVGALCFTLEQWHDQLGLRQSPAVAFGLSEDECYDFMVKNATRDDTHEVEYKAFFNCDAPAARRPVVRAEPAAAAATTEPPARRSVFRGRVTHRLRPVAYHTEPASEGRLTPLRFRF